MLIFFSHSCFEQANILNNTSRLKKEASFIVAWQHLTQMVTIYFAVNLRWKFADGYRSSICLTKLQIHASHLLDTLDTWTVRFKILERLTLHVIESWWSVWTFCYFPWDADMRYDCFSWTILLDYLLTRKQIHSITPLQDCTHDCDVVQCSYIRIFWP